MIARMQNVSLARLQSEPIAGVIVNGLAHVRAPLICLYIHTHTIKGGRKKTDCCKVTKPPAPSLKCNVTTCDIDPGLCEIAAEDGYEKRKVHTFEKRGPPREFKWPVFGFTQLIMRSRRYPDGRGYMRYLQDGVRGLASRWWRMRSDNCGRPDLGGEQLSRDGRNAPYAAEVEHIVPVRVPFPFYHALFINHYVDFGRLTNE